MKLSKAIYKYFKKVYGLKKEEVVKLITKHTLYDTCIFIKDRGFARFNISGDTTHILDCIIISGGLKTLRELCKEGRRRFPYVKKIRYERSLKNRNFKTFDFNNFTKG